jgi:hypothetical protein
MKMSWVSYLKRRNGLRASSQSLSISVPFYFLYNHILYEVCLLPVAVIDERRSAQLTAL